MAERTRLTELREEIAEVTLNIFRLCSERLQLAEQIAKVKDQQKIAVEDLRVEQELEAKVLEVCENCDMSKEFCLELLGLLLKESKRVQREIVRSEA